MVSCRDLFRLERRYLARSSVLPRNVRSSVPKNAAASIPGARPLPKYATKNAATTPIGATIEPPVTKSTTALMVFTRSRRRAATPRRSPRPRAAYARGDRKQGRVAGPPRDAERVARPERSQCEEHDARRAPSARSPARAQTACAARSRRAVTTANAIAAPPADHASARAPAAPKVTTITATSSPSTKTP